MSEVQTTVKIDKAAKAKASDVRIMIHEQEGAAGSDDVFVQDGNKEWLVKRGVEVDVPESVYNILKSAVITTYDPVKGVDGAIEYRPRNYPRFNMSRV